MERRSHQVNCHAVSMGGALLWNHVGVVIRNELFRAKLGFTSFTSSYLQLN